MKSFFTRLLHARHLYFFLLGLRRFLGRSFLMLLSTCCLAVYLVLTYVLLLKVDGLMQEKNQHILRQITGIMAEDRPLPAMKRELGKAIYANEAMTVVTDSGWHPLAWVRVPTGSPLSGKRVLGLADTSPVERASVAEQVRLLRMKYPPYPIFQSGGIIIGYCVLAKNPLTTILTWLFAILALFFLAFMIFMYVSFYNMRMNERSSLWVALAKETAHQLGTPLTALMGWVEYLRTARDGEDGQTPEEILGQIEKICNDMDNDLSRLRKISSRFSQIGSLPVQEPCDVNKVIADCLEYFRVRLPLLSRKIEIQQRFGDIPAINGNSELLEWVFENLLKNSMDAIQHDSGRIEITTEYLVKEQIVRVYYGDNGKGITWEAHKKIFSPGYTTKKRGWGLGLTLTKRIIEDYHQGKIIVYWSRKNKGTIFCIDLPLNATSKRNEDLVERIGPKE